VHVGGVNFAEEPKGLDAVKDLGVGHGFSSTESPRFHPTAARQKGVWRT